MQSRETRKTKQGMPTTRAGLVGVSKRGERAAAAKDRHDREVSAKERQERESMNAHLDAVRRQEDAKRHRDMMIRANDMKRMRFFMNGVSSPKPGGGIQTHSWAKNAELAAEAAAAAVGTSSASSTAASATYAAGMAAKARDAFAAGARHQ